ncbi:hypothetical protein [Anianabacter salinae]|uniref:hypothetical protein n=1 Tax=Anianabacter salinae TaxID=2851023 RepID=UPI00225E4983|nr:hypothetical protein [Anianabacter salinae]MBV0912095.1 hypothetical protein [Anianabacter salinae]
MKADRARRRWRIAGLAVAAAFAVFAALWLIPYTPPPERAETLVAQAVAAATLEAETALEAELAPVFAPVHAAVPAYLDFHYSVFGQYTELLAALAEWSDADALSPLEHRLFEGYDARLDAATDRLSLLQSEAFEAHLSDALRQEAGWRPVSPVIARSVERTLDRTRMTLPLAAAGGIGGGAIAARLVSRSMMRLVQKQAAKVAARGAGVGGGAAAGAAAGTLLGPVGTVVGGVIGGAASYLVLDHAGVKLDEMFTRNSFEAELHAMIEEVQATVSSDLAETLTARGQDLGGRTLQAMHAGRSAGL